tara:strand:+ start:490 stop:708 length:219 start_codon:yes stop_codon:yes gene_type:complete
MQGNLITLLISFTLSLGAFFAAKHNMPPVQKIEFTKPIEIKGGEEVYDDGDSMNIHWMSSHEAQLLMYPKQK